MSAAPRLFYLGLAASSLLSLRVGGVTVGDVLLLLSFVVLLLNFDRWPARAPLAGHTGGGVLLAIVAAAALASLSTAAPDENWAVAARLVYLLVIVPWQACLLLTTTERVRTAALWWTGGAALCAFGTVLQFVFGSEIIPGGDVTSAGRYTGFTSHTSDIGGITAVGVIVCVALLSGELGRRTRAAVAVMLTCCTIGVFLAGSVSAMLAILAAAVFLIVRGAIKAWQVGVFGALAALAFLVAGFIQAQTSNALTPAQRIAQTLGLATYNTQATGLNTSKSRMETIRLGVTQFLAPPHLGADRVWKYPFLGSGLDPEAGLILGPLQVHNVLVAALYQGGVVLAVALTLLLWRHWRLMLTPDKHGLVVTLGAGYLAALTFSMTAPSMYNRYLWLPAALLLAAAVTAAHVGLEDRSPRGGTGRSGGGAPVQARPGASVAAPVAIPDRPGDGRHARAGEL